jgi:hypothetical protein
MEKLIDAAIQLFQEIDAYTMEEKQSQEVQDKLNIKVKPR